MDPDIDSIDMLGPLCQQHRMMPGSAAKIQCPAVGRGQQAVQQPVYRLGALTPVQLDQPVIICGDPVEGLRFRTPGSHRPHAQGQ
jgi:hypothetical protein